FPTRRSSDLDDGDLLHVRREAVRTSGVELTAARGEVGTEARPGDRLHGARRREPEGTGELVSERVAGLPGGAEKTTREPGPGVRRRRGDCIAALPGNGDDAGGAGRAQEVRRP